ARPSLRIWLEAPVSRMKLRGREPLTRTFTYMWFSRMLIGITSAFCAKVALLSKAEARPPPSTPLPCNEACGDSNKTTEQTNKNTDSLVNLILNFLLTDGSTRNGKP